MKTKIKDFIELHYTGYVDNKVFDTTEEDIAKKHKIDRPNANYKPQIICIGEKWVLPGLDKDLKEKELNKDYEVIIEPPEAFGKKDPKLIQIVPTLTLTKQKIRPYPGLQIYAGNLTGTIRTVTGGRTSVDFNHPLAGKILTYKYKITKIIKDKTTKTKAMLEYGLNLQQKDYEIKEKDNKVNISLKPKIPKDSKTKFIKKAKELGIEVTFDDN